MANVHGDFVLQPGTQGNSARDVSFTSLLDEEAHMGLMSPADVQRVAREQLRMMKGYPWATNVAFSNERSFVEELNADGVLRHGRTPRHVPMLRAAPMRLPYLKHGVAAVSMRAADGGELCVPAAIYAWLKGRKDRGSQLMPKAACEKYPEALPCVADYRGRLSKPKLTLETVTALLNAIHTGNGDKGHTIEDVEKLCRLFGCNMVALDRDGLVIGQVVDGDEHHPLYYTMAHGHMYWHCDKQDILSIKDLARQQRELGCKHYLAQGGALAARVTAPPKLCIVDVAQVKDLLATISEPTSVLVKGAKSVENVFYGLGWDNGEPTGTKVHERRVCRFTMKMKTPAGSEVDVVIGADPFFELAMRQNGDFDHRAIFDACAAKGITINPLDGLGNVTRALLRPTRKRVSQQERQAIFDKQRGACNRCDLSLGTCKVGHVDHVTPLANGGVDEASNKQLLCTECHNHKTAAENERGYSQDDSHLSRFNPYVLEHVALTREFQCLEFVESLPA